MARDVIADRVGNRRCRCAGSDGGEQRREPLPAVQAALLVHRLGHAVGDEHQRVAGRERERLHVIRVTFERTERRAARHDDRTRGLARAQQPRKLVACGGDFQPAVIKRDHAGQRGDEQAFAVVERDFGVGAREHGAEAGAPTQHLAAHQCLADRHDHARGQALAGHVTDHETRAALVELEKIVQVAADLARRFHQRGDFEPRVAPLRRVRQHAELYPIGCAQFAGKPCRGEPLVLQHLAQRAPLALGFPERRRKQPPEQQRQAEPGRGHVDQQVIRIEGAHAECRGERHQCGEYSDCRERPRARHDEQQHHPAEHQQAALERARRGRQRQKLAVEDVFDQLGMDLDAGHALTVWRERLVDHADSGHSDQHHLAFEYVRGDAALQNFRGRDKARWHMSAEPDPCMRIAVRRGRHVRRDGNLADTAGVDRHRDRRDAGGQAQQFQPEAREQRVSDRADQRHAAHRAVDVGGNQRAAGSRAIDLRNAGERPRIAVDERQGVGPGDAKRGGRMQVVHTARFAGTGDRQHGRPLRERDGEQFIVSGREAIGLGKQ